eukprot:847021_1
MDPKALESALRTGIPTMIASQKAKGNDYFKQRAYIDAISWYSKGLLALDGPIMLHCANTFLYIKTNNNKNDNKTRMARHYVTEQRVILLNNRAEAYRKLKKFKQSLRDLNWIISASKQWKQEHEPKMSWLATMVPHCKKALLRRANILYDLGNTAYALADYMTIVSKPFNYHCCDKKIREMIRHPSTLTCVRYNDDTNKLNKLSIDGWIQIQHSSHSRALPLRLGHSLITHNGKIYCFGGSESSDDHTNANCGDALFLEISISRKNDPDGTYYYTWKKLSFPEHLKNKIMDQRQWLTSWSTLCSIHKWKGYLVLFGGTDPFNNVLLFHFATKKWSVLRTSKFGNSFPRRELDGHSAAMIRNKLYIFGGCSRGIGNMIWCLDLNQKRWIRLHQAKETVPPHKFDHFMWYDAKKGTSGSLHVCYGSFYCKGNDTRSFCRSDCWRYDIAQNQWNTVYLLGNPPSVRAESGIVALPSNKGAIIFGGYNGSVPSKSKQWSSSGAIGAYTFFADCFEYDNKNSIWRMIQAHTYPGHRALCAMVEWNGMIVLYGGYHGGQGSEIRAFNDLWILDIERCKTKSCETKYCMICQKSSNEKRLYLCKKCKNKHATYCSKRCQKYDWKRHKINCRLS